MILSFDRSDMNNTDHRLNSMTINNRQTSISANSPYSHSILTSGTPRESGIGLQIETETIDNNSPPIVQAPMTVSNIPDSHLLTALRTTVIEISSQGRRVKLLRDIKGADELIKKFDEFINELDLQQDNIALALTRTTDKHLVKENIYGILKTLQDIRLNITELDGYQNSILPISKTKWKNRIQTLHQTFRSKCNQLMTSMTLDMISNAKPVSVYGQEGLPEVYSYYYGLNRPVNHKEAFLRLVDLSEKDNNTDAMILLSECYLNGHGIKKPDQLLGRQWLERAVAGNNTAAKSKLALLILEDSKDLALTEEERNSFSQNARDLLIEAAILGNVEAETTLGLLSYEIEDYSQAVEWFTRGMNHNDPKSINHMGLLYYHGDGVIRQPELSFEYFVTAANSGDQDACNNAAVCLERGVGTEKNLLEAMYYYHLSARKGSANAMYSLGFLFIKRAIGMYSLVSANDSRLTNRLGAGLIANDFTIQSKDKNRMILRSFIESGIIDNSIIKTISSTSNTRTNQQEIFYEVDVIMSNGLYWMRRAVEGGIYDAAFQLGQIYEQGLGGLPIDYFAAFSQYQYAALKGNSRSALCVGHMLYEGLGTSRDFIAACTYYESSALSGLVEGMNSLGLLLEDGRGCIDSIPDPNEAATWYLEAAKLGSEQAGMNLASLIIKHHEIISITTRLGAELTITEVKKFLIDNIPSTKYIFQDAKDIKHFQINNINSRNIIQSNHEIDGLQNHLNEISQENLRSVPKANNIKLSMLKDSPGKRKKNPAANNLMMSTSLPQVNKHRSIISPPRSLRADFKE